MMNKGEYLNWIISVDGKERKIGQATGEFCDKGNLWKYWNTIHSIMKRILTQKNGENVIQAIHYKENPEIYDNLGTSSYNRIDRRIEIGKEVVPSIPPEKPAIIMLWALLHEFGHFLDEKPPSRRTKEAVYKREVTAWKNAEEIVSAYDDIFKELDEFRVRRDECLLAYREYLGI